MRPSPRRYRPSPLKIVRSETRPINCSQRANFNLAFL